MKALVFTEKRIFGIFLLLSILLAVGGCSSGSAGTGPKVLIVMDEREQMEVLAEYMEKNGAVKSTIVDQADLPADISSYDAVIGYIHKTLEQKTERAIIDYTRQGGRYVCIHHSISSKKSLNEFYFDFLGIQLDNIEEAKNPATPGGHYSWRHPIELTVVNLNPDHFITANNINWDESILYMPSDQPSVEKQYPAFTIAETEFYLNHKFTDGREKTVLMGFKCVDDRNGIVFMQDRAAWIKKQGKGHIFYFKAGHSTQEFRNENLAQILLNAVLWQP